MLHPYIQGVQDKVYKNEIVGLLREALAAELISSYNYWVQSKLIEGFNKENVQKELIEHSQEEKEHADLLVNRILELGGDPEIRPLDWDRISKCRYMPVIDRDQVAIIDDAIKGEQCAIEHYTGILKFTENKDVTTNQLIHRIINDEFEHIRDLNKAKKDVTDHIPEADTSIEATPAPEDAADMGQEQQPPQEVPNGF